MTTPGFPKSSRRRMPAPRLLEAAAGKAGLPRHARAALRCAFGLVFLGLVAIQPESGWLFKLPQWILLLPVGLLGLWGGSNTTRQGKVPQGSVSEQQHVDLYCKQRRPPYYISPPSSSALITTSAEAGVLPTERRRWGTRALK